MPHIRIHADLIIHHKRTYSDSSPLSNTNIIFPIRNTAHLLTTQYCFYPSIRALGFARKPLRQTATHNRAAGYKAAAMAFLIFRTPRCPSDACAPLGTPASETVACFSQTSKNRRSLPRFKSLSPDSSSAAGNSPSCPSQPQIMAASLSQKLRRTIASGFSPFKNKTAAKQIPASYFLHIRIYCNGCSLHSIKTAP